MRCSRPDPYQEDLWASYPSHFEEGNVHQGVSWMPRMSRPSLPEDYNVANVQPGGMGR